MNGPFATPRTSIGEIPRDRWGRPMIAPPGQAERTAYTRVSTLAKALDDASGLINWSSAMTLLGAAKSETIVRGALGLDYKSDRRQVMDLVEQAKTLGGAADARTEGTTLHTHTERIDTGVPLPDGLDATTLADLDAYRRVTACLTPVMAETFVVLDDLRVAGTFDRVVDVAADDRVPVWLHGRRCVADLKTGGIDYAIGAFAVQLALYSRGMLYDPKTEGRYPLGADRDIGLVIHLPQRTGQAAIYAVNLDAGWRAVQLAVAVRDWRSSARLSNRNYSSPVVTQVASV